MSRTVMGCIAALAALLLVVPCRGTPARGEDWPMWRCDAARSGQTTQALPEPLHLLWTRQLPPMKPAFREPRLQFDAGYEPVVLGSRLFVAVPADDTVRAFNTVSGQQHWVFFADAPVRLASVAWKDRVFFGSDDGRVYCVSAAEGKLHWSFQAVPSERKVLGNGRLVSVWPVRGGPVLHDGKLYFAAGVFPFEGVFVYALDAQTGNLIWRNDESGYLYGIQPHGAESIGGVTPQGYLVVNGSELVVPCGQALPARYDLATGKLVAFGLPKAGRAPGGWFASADIRRGEVVLDAGINQDLHEDKVYQGPGKPEVRATIHVGDRPLKFGDGLPEVAGQVHTMLAADGKLFAVTTAGQLCAFGPQKPPSVARHAPKPEALQAAADGNSVGAEALLTASAERHGWAAIFGLDDIALLDALLQKTHFQIVGFDTDAAKVDRLRRRYAAAGLYGSRITLATAEPGSLDLPPYFAELAVLADARWLAAPNEKAHRRTLQILRPYGGTACIAASREEHDRLAAAGAFEGLAAERRENATILRRQGALPGAANYTGDWKSAEQGVKAPLGLLWFDDTLGHFKRSPQPFFVDGLMVSYFKDWMARHREGVKVPYDLLPPVLSDVYTGRVLSQEEQAHEMPHLPTRDLKAVQPNQYRPPYQADDWSPGKPAAGDRVNPLTEEREPRTFPKSYGCDGGVDYGPFYTMRSGTAAYYDKRIESGTCYISGPRSGCTNSVIPACGLMNVPYFYEGCTCSYPLPCALALASMPPEHEQWAAWGEGKADKIRRVGVNFGSPGDRMTDAGTLWLDYPSRGGPSPQLDLQVEPATARYFYHHSLWIEGGEGWPWVVASGVEGATRIRLGGLCEGPFTVRLFFADPQFEKPGERLFHVAVNGRQAAGSFDVAKAAAGRMRGTVLQLDDVPLDAALEITLAPSKGSTILSGIELISTREGQSP
ncbi:MAG: outer membrane protein assembly factor BamB family protein [Thermoguttaceae bacterium]